MDAILAMQLVAAFVPVLIGLVLDAPPLTGGADRRRVRTGLAVAAPGAGAGLSPEDDRYWAATVVTAVYRGARRGVREAAPRSLAADRVAQHQERQPVQGERVFGP